MYTFKLWKLALQIFQPRSCQPPATKRLVCIAPYKTTAGGSNTEIFWERSLINLGGSCMIGNLTFTISSYTLPGTKISHPKSAPMKMVFLYIYIYMSFLEGFHRVASTFPTVCSVRCSLSGPSLLASRPYTRGVSSAFRENGGKPSQKKLRAWQVRTWKFVVGRWISKRFVLFCHFSGVGEWLLVSGSVYCLILFI